jgi:autotransporter-associated beta strand protein
VSEGQLEITSTSALPGWNQSGRWAVDPGAVLVVTNTVSTSEVDALLLTGNVSNGGFGFDTSAGDRTHPTAISGSLALWKFGANTLTLTASNSFSGDTRVVSGSLALKNVDALAGSALDMNAGDAGVVAFTVAGTNTYTLGGLKGVRNLDMAVNSLIVGANGASTTYGGILSGSGSLTKVGGGVLTLAGSNTFSGTTRVAAGSLALQNTNALTESTLDMNVVDTGSVSFVLAGTNTYFLGGLEGPRNLAMGVNSLNVGRNGLSTTYGGVLSGSGSLTKSGTGVLTLTGSNSYSGGTFVLGGTLLGNATSLRGTITNDAAVEFNQLTTGTYSGVTIGTGSLTKSGLGLLRLSGANTYSGGTVVLGGTLLGNATSIQGAITNDAAVEFNQLTTGTYSGVMIGTGSLTKSGPGLLRLSGANTYSGGTVVLGGTLLGNATSVQGAIVNNAAVVFNQTTPGTYTGDMSGSGSLTKVGGSVLTLAGTNSYTGGTLVSSGTLVGNAASLQGSITNNAVIVFDQRTTGTYAGDRTGS